MREPADVVSVVAEVAQQQVAVGTAGILVQGGAAATATTVAHELGLPSRYALARHLRRSGALPFVELRQWIAVDRALRTFEDHGTTPCKVLLTAGKNPAGFYRMVQRLTDRTWTEVRELGSAWFLARFAERCREHCAGAVPADDGIGQLIHRMRSAGRPEPADGSET
jgi:hypothetical protein